MDTYYDQPPCFCGHETTEHHIKIRSNGSVTLDRCERCGCQVYDPDCPHEHCAPLNAGYGKGAVCVDCGYEEIPE
jgi:hypothetical protein